MGRRTRRRELTIEAVSTAAAARHWRAQSKTNAFLDATFLDWRKAERKNSSSPLNFLCLKAELFFRDRPGGNLRTSTMATHFEFYAVCDVCVA